MLSVCGIVGSQVRAAFFSVFFCFFFFKQKTAYEIMPSLVGSEMCIRDRYTYKLVTSAVPAERSDLEIDLVTEGRQRGVGTRGEVGDDDVGSSERDPAVGREGVVGEPVVTRALVCTRDPERRDRSSAKSGDRVDSLAGCDSRESPPGAGTQIPRPLSDDRHVRRGDMARREESGVHVHRFQVSAECLSDGDAGL